MYSLGKLVKYMAEWGDKKNEQVHTIRFMFQLKKFACELCGHTLVTWLLETDRKVTTFWVSQAPSKASGAVERSHILVLIYGKHLTLKTQTLWGEPEDNSMQNIVWKNVNLVWEFGIPQGTVSSSHNMVLNRNADLKDCVICS